MIRRYHGGLCKDWRHAQSYFPGVRSYTASTSGSRKTAIIYRQSCLAWSCGLTDLLGLLAGLPEEELDEEVTQGRNVQIRHHLPRHSVEARRSHGLADR